MQRKANEDLEHLVSPPKRLDITHDDVSNFKQPQIPINKKRGLKILTKEQLENIIALSNKDISIDKVESSIDNASTDLEGPWTYTNAHEVNAHYIIQENGIHYKKSIQLNHLLSRGFPKKNPHFNIPGIHGRASRICVKRKVHSKMSSKRKNFFKCADEG